eukprot:COSAG01_NODE_15074_length_1377_cov_10.768388_1_plen_103_part_10
MLPWGALPQARDAGRRARLLRRLHSRARPRQCAAPTPPPVVVPSLTQVHVGGFPWLQMACCASPVRSIATHPPAKVPSKAPGTRAQQAPPAAAPTAAEIHAQR